MKGIEIKDISKSYKNVTALDHVSVTFAPGKIYGLLGRNGAGKSTLINLIANRIFPDAGDIFIDGLPAKENMHIHEKIFCMSETDLYDPDLKVKDHFKWISRFYDCFDIDQAFAVASRFGLDTSKKFKTLSKGYQSIFKLTAALALHVPYVIFDEPVLGLDANHRTLFYDLLLKDYETDERTMIIATHLIEEVSHIIEDVVLIDQGKVLLCENTEALLAMGYSVSGLAPEVDAYCADKHVIGFDELGGLKIAYILGERTPLLKTGHLQISSMNLQKLFVKLTEKGGQPL